MYLQIGRLLKRLEWGLVAVCVILMVVMTAVMTLLVVTRNFFDFSFPWSEEITRFMMIWLVFLGAAVLVNRDDHIALDALPKILNGWRRFALMVFIRSVTIVALVLLFNQAILITGTRALTLSPALGLSLAWVYVAIPISAALMVVFQTYRIWTDWRKLNEMEV